MTDREPDDAAGVKIFPPGAPLATVLGGLALDRLVPLGFPIAASPSLRWALGGAIVAASIALLGFWAVRTMRRTGQSENPYQPTTEIVESGPFAFTRNPMYLQMVIACIGFAIVFANSWILLLTPLCWAALHFLVIRYEEAYLERKFGQPYRDYKRRVRRWL